MSIDLISIERRWLPLLYATLAIAYLIPIWTVAHLPTADGPSHLYNSWILRELIAGNHGPISRYFEIDWRPHPNWIGHALLAMLMSVVAPVTAEKILVSAIVLLFFGGVWAYSGGSPYAFIAFPFAYHRLLQSGFYNFSISVGLYFLIVAVWWKRREHATPGTIGLVASLLLVCYFSHPASTALAMATIGMLWLLALHGRRPAHLLAFVPAAVLLALFARQQRPEVSLATVTEIGNRLRDFIRIDILFTFDFRQYRLSHAVFALLCVLALVTAIREWRRRDANVFLAVTLAGLLIYCSAPDEIAGGQAVSQRIAVLIYLLPLPWFTRSLSRWMRVGLVALLTIVAIGNLQYLTSRYHFVDRHLTEFLQSLTGVGSDTTIVPVVFQTPPPELFVAAYSHVVDYVAIEKRLVDFDNYEAATGYFPIRFKANVQPAGVYTIEAEPEKLDLPFLSRQAKIVFTWKMNPGTSFEKRLQQQYHRVSETASGRVYRSLGLHEADLAGAPMFLLPIAGTLHDRNGWRVDQFVRNTGRSTPHLVLNTCEESCELDVAPGREERLASDDPTPYIEAFVTRGNPNDLTFSTMVSYAGHARVAIPTIRDKDFRIRTTRIPNVPFGDARLVLRGWFIGNGPDVVFIRAYSRDGRLVAERIERISPAGFATATDMRHDFPQIATGTIVDIELDAGSENRRVWAFITATDANNSRVRLYESR
jgi:hypothetical protein